MAAYYDLDAFLDGQEAITVVFKGKKHELDPDIPFPDLLRAFTTMQELSNIDRENMSEENMNEMVGMFKSMEAIMEAIVGEDVWAELRADRIGFRGIQWLLPQLMTSVTDSMSGEETPMTPEEEEERALAESAGGEGKAAELAASPLGTSPESSPHSERISAVPTVSGESR